VFDRIVGESKQDRKLKCRVPLYLSHSVLMEVLLQAMKVDVPLDVKCKDKFLLQSTQILDSSNDASLSDLVPPWR
jgi:hypothetical protein